MRQLSSAPFVTVPEVVPAELDTVPLARNVGFLCVISLFSTFLRCLVTSAPRFSSANTAAVPPWAGAAATSSGGGGGGGGGGAPFDLVAAVYSLTGVP